GDDAALAAARRQPDDRGERLTLLDEEVVDTEVGGALRLSEPLVAENAGRGALEELADLQHPALLLPQPPAHLWGQPVPLRPVAAMAKLLEIKGHIFPAQSARVDVVPVAQQLQAVDRPLALLAPLAG